MAAIAKQKRVPIVGLTAGLLFAAVAASWFYTDSRARHYAELNRSLAPQGNIRQSGSLVGWASGARISPSDTTMVEFGEISNARKLMQRDEFEYSGYLLRITQVAQVVYAAPDLAPGSHSASVPDTTLVQVVAKIQRAP